MRFLLFCLLLSAASSLYAQKKGNSQEVLLIDSLKKDLAEARREWQKCKENSDAAQATTTQNVGSLSTENAALKERLTNAENKIRNSADSLRLLREACARLQADLAARDMKKSALETKLQQLQLQLLDSLQAWQGPQLSIYKKGNLLLLEVGDSILFGGAYAINPNGQKFLTKLSAVLLQHPNVRLVAQGFSEEGTAANAVWREASRRAIAVLTVLENLKFPSERMSAQAMGSWKGDKKHKKAPILIELDLE